MQCSRCYFENTAGERVCQYCGTPLDGNGVADKPVVSTTARKRTTQLGSAPDPGAWSRTPPTPPLDPEDPFRVAARSVGEAPGAPPDEPAPAASGTRATVVDEGVAPTRGAVAGAMLVFEPSGRPRVQLLHQGRTTIGRAPGCDMVLQDPRVSADHAILRIEGSTAWLLDTSTNGTLNSGVRVLNDKAPLRDDAVLEMGRTRMVVKLLSEGAVAALVEDR